MSRIEKNASQSPSKSPKHRYRNFFTKRSVSSLDGFSDATSATATRDRKTSAVTMRKWNSSTILNEPVMVASDVDGKTANSKLQQKEQLFDVATAQKTSQHEAVQESDNELSSSHSMTALKPSTPRRFVANMFKLKSAKRQDRYSVDQSCDDMISDGEIPRSIITTPNGTDRSNIEILPTHTYEQRRDSGVGGCSFSSNVSSDQMLTPNSGGFLSPPRFVFPKPGEFLSISSDSLSSDSSSPLINSQTYRTLIKQDVGHATQQVMTSLYDVTPFCI